MSQLSMFGANARTSPQADKRRIPSPRPAILPQEAAKPLAGLGFGELFFLPRRALELGLRVVRWDDCRRCGRDTSHVFTLIYLSPRTWARACLECLCNRSGNG